MNCQDEKLKNEEKIEKHQKSPMRIGCGIFIIIAALWAMAAANPFNMMRFNMAGAIGQLAMFCIMILVGIALIIKKKSRN